MTVLEAIAVEPGTDYTVVDIDGHPHTFGWSDAAAKEEYSLYCQMSDDEWRKSVVGILHFSAAVAYRFKLNVEQTLSDKAIIHELIHLLHIPDEPLIDLVEIRQLFVKTFDPYLSTV